MLTKSRRTRNWIYQKDTENTVCWNELRLMENNFLEKVKSQPSKRYERSDGNKKQKQKNRCTVTKANQSKTYQENKNDEIHHHDSLLVSFVALGRSWFYSWFFFLFLIVVVFTPLLLVDVSHYCSRCDVVCSHNVWIIRARVWRNDQSNATDSKFIFMTS